MLEKIKNIVNNNPILIIDNYLTTCTTIFFPVPSKLILLRHYVSVPLSSLYSSFSNVRKYGIFRLPLNSKIFAKNCFFPCEIFAISFFLTLSGSDDASSTLVVQDRVQKTRAYILANIFAERN